MYTTSDNSILNVQHKHTTWVKHTRQNRRTMIYCMQSHIIGTDFCVHQHLNHVQIVEMSFITSFMLNSGHCCYVCDSLPFQTLCNNMEIAAPWEVKSFHYFKLCDKMRMTKCF